MPNGRANGEPDRETVHPWRQLSDHSDTSSDSHAHSTAECVRCTDRTTDDSAGRNRDVTFTHQRADTDAGDDRIADAVSGCSVAEPRSRGARIVRIRRNDRFLCVDLASLPELTSARVIRVPPLDKCERVTTMTRT